MEIKIDVENPIVRGPLTLFALFSSEPEAEAYVTGPASEVAGEVRCRESNGFTEFFHADSFWELWYFKASSRSWASLFAPNFHVEPRIARARRGFRLNPRLVL